MSARRCRPTAATSCISACAGCQRCERFARFPRFPRESLVALRDHTPYRLGLIANSDSCASFATGITRWRAGAPGSARPDKRPDGPRASLAQASWFRIDDAKSGNTGTPRNMSTLYNASIFQSTTQVSRPRVLLLRLLRLRGGPCMAGRPGDTATPCVAGPECLQCFQRLRIVKTSEPLRHSALTPAASRIGFQ